MVMASTRPRGPRFGACCVAVSNVTHPTLRDYGDMHPTPDLETIIRDLDRHVAGDGWAQPPRLFALVMQGDETSVVEQPWESTGEELLADLAGIAWPPEVTGAALSVQRLLENRTDVRVTVGALRDQTVATALRYREHDSDDDVAVAAGVVPRLERALWDTLQ